MDDLKALEREWGKIVQLEEAGKEVPEEIQRKIYAAIEVQGQKLAEIDGEESKLSQYDRAGGQRTCLCQGQGL